MPIFSTVDEGMMDTHLAFLELSWATTVKLACLPH